MACVVAGIDPAIQHRARATRKIHSALLPHAPRRLHAVRRDAPRRRRVATSLHRRVGASLRSHTDALDTSRCRAVRARTHAREGIQRRAPRRPRGANHGVARPGGKQTAFNVQVFVRSVERACSCTSQRNFDFRVRTADERSVTRRAGRRRVRTATISWITSTSAARSCASRSSATASR